MSVTKLQRKVKLKVSSNIVLVHQYWNFKHEYSHHKRGIGILAWELPGFIKRIGIGKVRQSLRERDQETTKVKMRKRVRFKLKTHDNISLDFLNDVLFPSGRRFSPFYHIVVLPADVAEEKVNWRRQEWSRGLFCDESGFTVNFDNLCLFIWKEPLSPPNGEMSPRENGTERGLKRERPPSRSGSSSSRSTPSSAKHKDHVNVKPPTPVSKPVTPTSSGSTTPSSSGIKPHPKHALGPPYPYALHGGAALAGELGTATAFPQGVLHNNISPALNSYSRSLVGFDHPSMCTPGFGSIPGGKP
ncbi:transducin-like enhancer protein 3-A [Trichonephila inaurata madagascariensis]|uniref:Transducin-like enhancer protein 3-A n=1 Tax=Trichonephila inaurata madagascariensis TaxID=2747483 RepID=A0A8X7BN36_9ARAC|nr:transducin-like enhancer protein 3-A [Trichonephila inaurata madagascariensis]